MGDKAVAKAGDNSAEFRSFVRENDDMRLRNRRIVSPVLPQVSTEPVTGEASEPSFGIEYDEDVPTQPLQSTIGNASALNIEEPTMAMEQTITGVLLPETGDLDDVRDQSIEFPSSRLTHPPPAAYDDASIENDVKLFAEAPWFNRDSLRDEGLIRRYAVDGWLPGNIPVDAVFTVCWRNQFACHRRDFRIPRGRSAADVRAGFAELAMSGYNRLLTFSLCDPAETGMFVYRTNGEVEYLRRLNVLPDILLEEWRGQSAVAPAALCFPRPQLVKEFRFSRKQGSYWTAFVRNERRSRSKYGVAVPYQCLNTFGLKGEYFQRAFPRLNQAWQRIEVPRGCNVELPPVFSYKSCELKHRDSGWWVVAYTEMAAKTAAFVLFDAYDQFRLWALSSLMIEHIRALDLVAVLGNRQNADELLEFLLKIEATNFASLPSSWTARGQSVSAAPGRSGPGADFVWYDPYERKFVSLEEAKSLARAPRVMIPDDHPLGWDYSDFADGYQMPVGGHVVRVGRGRTAGAGWDNDVPVEGVGAYVDDDVDQHNVVRGGPPMPAVAAEAVPVEPVVVRPPSPVSPGPLPEIAVVRASIAGGEGDVDAVRRFLLDVGVERRVVDGASYAELRGYLRGRMNL